MPETQINIEIKDYKAVKAVVMGSLLGDYTVRLFERPGDYVVRAWKDILENY